MFVHVADDLHVLLGKPFGAVHHQKADVGTAHRVESAHDAVIFHVVAHVLLAADPRRVDERIFLSVERESGIDRVARRARDIGDDGTFESQKAVDEAAFAALGLPTTAIFKLSVSSSSPSPK